VVRAFWLLVDTNVHGEIWEFDCFGMEQNPDVGFIITLLLLLLFFKRHASSAGGLASKQSDYWLLL
jgi:hypothetical protein